MLLPLCVLNVRAAASRMFRVCRSCVLDMRAAASGMFTVCGDVRGAFRVTCPLFGFCRTARSPHERKARNQNKNPCHVNDGGCQRL